MNEETLIKCYHGTSKENEIKILKEGFKESKPNQGHWLGKGVYFYENIYYAIEWGIIYFLNNSATYDEYTEKCTVIETKINLDDFEILDLNDPIGYKYYLEIEKNIKERFPEKIKNIENDGDIELIRLMEKIEEETHNSYISMFDILIASYPKDIYKKGNKKIKGNFLPCIQKQICVKNKKAINEITSVNLNKSEIERYFYIIMDNRRENENEKQCRIIKNAIRKDKKYSR